MTGWSISVANTKRSLKSTIIRSNRCISLIPLILTLTALTFTLRSTGKMVSGKKDLPRKTEKNRLLVWDSCLMQIRFPSAWSCFRAIRVKSRWSEISLMIWKRETLCPAEPYRSPTKGWIVLKISSMRSKMGMDIFSLSP